MSEADDNDNPNGFLSKKGEVINVKATLSPEAEDRFRKSIQKKTYYGGPLGATLYIILMPIALIILHSMCSKDSCSLSTWQTFEFKYMDFLSAAVHLFVLFSALFIGCSLPLGPVKLGEPMMNGDREKYRMRIVYLCVMLSIPLSPFIVYPFLISSEYSGFMYSDIFNNFQYYLINVILLTFILSLYLYKRSFNVPRASLNIHGNTGSPIYDFFMGQELQPRTIFNVNIKTFVIMTSYATTIIMDLSFLQYQMIQRSGFGSPTLLLALLGNFLYGADFAVFEENYLTSMTVKHDGVGFLFIFNKLVITPMLATYHARHILIYKAEMTAEPIAILAFGCIVGCAIWHRFATADKALFTRDKDHPEVGAYDTIVTSSGKRLLVDGWWNGCRHPTYTCAICSALICCMVTGLSGVLPYIYFIYQLIYYIYRIKRNEDLCRFEYGEAWDVYCKRVPYKLVKYIY